MRNSLQHEVTNEELAKWLLSPRERRNVRPAADDMGRWTGARFGHELCITRGFMGSF